jgi:hypothetical protein
MVLVDAFLETSSVLQRASIAGAVGLGAGPLFFLTKSSRIPMWRTSLIGASAFASISFPFLCMERLSYHAITCANFKTEVSAQQQRDTRKNTLYTSHTVGTILGAGLLRASMKGNGPFRVPVVPFKVLLAMLCKAHIETLLLDQRL